MPKSQTYQTRHLTARDHQLIDALETDPRFRHIANVLRPRGSKPVPKPQPKTEAPEAPKPKAEAPKDEPPEAAPKAEAPEVQKPTPKEPPAPAQPVSGMTMKDAPNLGGKGR